MAERPPVSITAEARKALLALRAQDPEPERLGLRIAVVGVSGGSYAHDMSFELLDDAAADDVVFHHDDLPLIVPRDSVEALRGATIDLAEGGEGWTIANPNRPKPERRQLPLAPVGGHAHAPPSSPAVGAAVPEGLAESLQGDVAQRVATVLERHINPSIAMHGGHAELAGVQEGTAYLRLSGGCQGCSMAAVTLRQGIETALRELVPEITEVVDVTDHASGTNPYYEAAKH